MDKSYHKRHSKEMLFNVRQDATGKGKNNMKNDIIEKET